MKKKNQLSKEEEAEFFADTLWPDKISLANWRKHPGYTLAQKAFLAGFETGSREREAEMLRFAGVVSGVPMDELKNIWRNYRERHGI